MNIIKYNNNYEYKNEKIDNIVNYFSLDYFYFLTFTVPGPNKGSYKGFSSSIYSSVNILNFKINTENTLIRMHHLQLKRIILILICIINLK